MKSYKTPLPFFALSFFAEMDAHPTDYGEDIWSLRYRVIEKAFLEEELIVDEDLARKYLGLSEYFPFRLLSYQECAFCLWSCVFRKESGLPRWPTLVILGGRGLGKDGFIAFSAFALTSPYNPAPDYDVDICANNEEQAMRPLEDVISVLEQPSQEAKLKRFYYHTKEVVQGRANGGKIKGRTNNPKGRDGMRSGCIVFNELHQYTDYKNINVFRTGLGKKKQPRILMVTTNGDVVDGPLDEYLKRCDNILSGKKPDGGWLPFLFRLKSEEDVMNPDKWVQANPRLKHSPELLYEYQEEFEDYKINPDINAAFSTKRMNFRRSNREICVTDWKNIEATNRMIPDLTGKDCVVGIDYSKSSDWVAINLHFKDGSTRYDINHAFVCTQGADFPKLNCPHDQWVQKGLITYVDEPDIQPRWVTAYLEEAMKKYHIVGLAVDSFRWGLLSSALLDMGFSLKNKNLKLTRRSDIMKVVPVIDSCFNNRFFSWGDNPVLRWATNNTSLERATSSNITISGTADTGNFVYSKIEPIKRKTDPFMALVMSMTLENELPDTTMLSGSDVSDFFFSF